jgi:uncharacterized membrane protein
MRRAAVLFTVLASFPAFAQVATAPPSYDVAPNKLTAAEVKAQFAGKHEEDGVDIKGHAWTIRVAANGNTSIVAGSYGDSGHMVLRGDAVCVAWNKAWHGQERCFHYAHHGQQLASYGPDGALNSTLTISR